ncbi:S66 family peptidase [Thermohalobacter berrensis]|uniref:Peptidase S66 n=1 Tax=Thermohalobacter berrensis TaxID=99594 RepID=A0A419SXL6_9FIRM|nr:S66 peptidase family protein [Thermohalobacter berrensis]RKD30013.1 hypothetical protein BET03_04730 [Thermohalobacter berrensis]
MIRYPEPLKVGDTIGITAPSSGVTGVISYRLDNAIKQLQELGYKIVETDSVRRQNKLTSAPPNIRAKEFTSLYLDRDVKAIIPPWGGEFLMSMLSYLDFQKLKEAEPKWILGFSDTSTLLFTLTLNLNIATAHGPNALDFGGTPIHYSVLDSLKILSLENGQNFQQRSMDKYQKEWLEVTKNTFPPYNLTEKVEWKVLGNEKEIKMGGRFIGGNLDVICKLIGTPFAPVRKFIDKYKSDGFIWYFESCEMNSTDIYRTLWQMKQNGWFEGCNGFLFGRPEGYSDVADFTLVDALKYSLSDLDIPVVYDVDIGHMPPQLTLINGAYGEVAVKNGEGLVKQTLK